MDDEISFLRKQLQTELQLISQIKDKMKSTLLTYVDGGDITSELKEIILLIEEKGK